jgi:hypothetical protein
LVRPHGAGHRFGEQQFPVVSLETARRTRAGNPVVDPVFVAERWVARNDFSAPAALPAPAPEPPSHEEKVIALVSKATGVAPETVKAEATAVFERPVAESIDDDIPF